MAEDVAIGIDLGTTYCCVAIYENGEVNIIENEVGSRTTPSYVTIDDDDIYVGEISKNLAHENPERTIFDVKRLIGRKFFDTFVQSDVKLWPFEIVADNLLPKIKVNDVTYFPEEISAKVLAYLKQTAEDYLGHPVTKAVITVPAYFNDGQRRATRDAGSLAGLQVLRIINEPSAAAIAYNLEKNVKDTKNCLIFDLGGGTFDVSVLTMSEGKIDIKAVDGHTHLGGEDFDVAMANHCIAQFKTVHGIDLNEVRRTGSDIAQRKAVKALRRLKAECERQKMFLSSAKKVEIGLFALYDGKDLNVPVTQELFNQLNEKKFTRCMEIVDSVMESSTLNKKDIHDIVLIGGSSRIPKIQQLLSDKFFGKSLAKGIDPETAVAYGAAVQANQIVKANAKRVTISDVVHLPIGIEYDRVNEGDPNFAIVVPKNSRIPCGFSSRYATVRDGQELIKINVFEGEGKTTEENHLLGNFEVTNLPKCQKGEPVQVTLDVDSDGILRVTASLSRHSVGNRVTVRKRSQMVDNFSELGVSMQNMEIVGKIESSPNSDTPPENPPPPPPTEEEEDPEPLTDLEETRNKFKLSRQESQSSMGSKGKEKKPSKFLTLSKTFARQKKNFTALHSIFHPTEKKPDKGASTPDQPFSNLPPINLGIHIDREGGVLVGVYNFEQSGECQVIDSNFCTSILFLEDQIVKGTKEMSKDYAENSKYFTFYRLLTVKATKIHELVHGGTQRVKLRNEEVLAAFLVDIKRSVELVKRGKVQNVTFSLSFLATSDQKERLKAASTLAGFQETRILSSLLATAISIGRPKDPPTDPSPLTPSKFIFVMQYDLQSFSGAIIEIQGQGTSVNTWSTFTTETLTPELRSDFKTNHALLLNGGQDEKVVKIVYDDIVKRCEKQAGNVPIKDFILVTSSDPLKFNGVDNLLMQILNHKLTKLNYTDGPLKGSSILASCMTPNQGPPFFSRPLNARDMSHFDLRFMVGDSEYPYEEFQHVFSHRLVFSQEVTVPKMRPCLISLKQVLPSGQDLSDVCHYLLTLPPKLKEGPVATINCHVDQDGVYSLVDIPMTGVHAQFVRTDRFLLDMDGAKGTDSNFSKFLIIFHGDTKRPSDAHSLH